MGVGIHPRAGAGVVLQHIGRGRVQRLLILLVGDELILIHAAQHIVGAVVGDAHIVHTLLGAGVVVAAGIVVIGAVAGAGQNGALPQGQLRQGFAEIALRGGLHTVIVFAQPDGVQVGFQNFVLGVFLLQLHGQVGLLDLALVALLAGKQGVFDQLLGDGGTALGGGRGQIGHKRTHDALQVDAGMGVEAGVLHGHKGLLQIFRHGGDGDHHAVLDALVFGDEIAVGVINKGGLRLILQRGQVQVGGGLHIALGDARHRAHQGKTGQKHHHRQDAHHVHRHGQHKVGLFRGRLEDAAGMHRLLLRQHRIVINRLLVPEILVGIGIHRLVIIRGVGILRRVDLLILLPGFVILSRELGGLLLLIALASSQRGSPPRTFRDVHRHKSTG